MLEAFAASFITALVFTIFAFLVIEEDLQRKSERVIYLLILAGLAWPISLTLLVAPGSSTTYVTQVYPAYNVITYNAPLGCAGGSIFTECGTTNTLTAYPSYSITTTTTQSSSTPFPVWAFFTYTLFVSGMTIILAILFLKYMAEYGLQLFIDGLKDLTKKKN